MPLGEVHTRSLQAGRGTENLDVARKFGGHSVRGSAVSFALKALGERGTGARPKGLIEK